MRHGTAKSGGSADEVRHGTAKEERGGDARSAAQHRERRERKAARVRHGTAKSGGSAGKVRHAPRKGEHNPTRNRKFANANNVSRRFMLPFY